MSMTFLQMQNAVIKNAFDESDRADVQEWLRARHAWLWDSEEWTFKRTKVDVTFTNNSQIVANVPGDFNTALGLWGEDGAPLRPYKDFTEFLDLYNTGLDPDGSPEAYTVIAGVVYVGPMGDGTTGQLLYEKHKPDLLINSNTTGLPDGYDTALVFGAKATGFKLSAIPLARDMDDDYVAAVNAMRRNYLVEVRDGEMRYGAYRAGVPRSASWR